MKVDNWISDWEAAEEQRARQRREAMAEDGWTLVVDGKVRDPNQ